MNIGKPLRVYESRPEAPENQPAPVQEPKPQIVEEPVPV